MFIIPDNTISFTTKKELENSWRRFKLCPLKESSNSLYLNLPSHHDLNWTILIFLCLKECLLTRSFAESWGVVADSFSCGSVDDLRLSGTQIWSLTDFCFVLLFAITGHSEKMCTYFTNAQYQGLQCFIWPVSWDWHTWRVSSLSLKVWNWRKSQGLGPLKGAVSPLKSPVQEQGKGVSWRIYQENNILPDKRLFICPTGRSIMFNKKTFWNKLN